MKRFMTIIAALAAFASCQAACSDNPSDSPSDPSFKEDVLEQIEVSRLASTSDGKVYLEVDGKAFPLFGAQIRVDVFKNCDEMEDSQIESYFKAASELGLNCVQVPITWKGWEPQKGEYDNSWIDLILGCAVKYGLKMELLWFSTNMIGDSYTYFVPTYAMGHASSRLKRGWDDNFHNLYGYYHELILDDEWLLEQETRAVTALFNHIRNWDAANGLTHPVITCQLHNEIDGLARWRLAEDSFTFQDGTALTEQKAWDMTLNAVDAVGQAIHNSSYKVATRVNYTSCTNPGTFPQCTDAAGRDALAKAGVDFISVDPYMNSVDEISSVVEAFRKESGNYPLIAENRGYYDTTPSLILATAALGGGYDIYDLATSPYIYTNNGFPWSEEGILTYDLFDRTHTPLTRSILKGLVEAGEDVALTSTENFLAYNVTANYPRENHTMIANTTGARFTVKAEGKGLGFILDRGDSLVMYFTSDTAVTVENGTLEGGSNSVRLNPGKLVRYAFASDGKLDSTTKKYIGTRFN